MKTIFIKYGLGVKMRYLWNKCVMRRISVNSADLAISYLLLDLDPRNLVLNYYNFCKLFQSVIFSTISKLSVKISAHFTAISDFWRCWISAISLNMSYFSVDSSEKFGAIPIQTACTCSDSCSNYNSCHDIF